MKKLFTAAALLLALCLCLTAALASGGDAGEALISLSYLEGDFSQALEESIIARLDAAKAPQDIPASGGNATLKEGDSLSGSTGMVLTPLGGEVRVSISGGAVVDVTDGREVDAGPLLRGHRYLVAENAAAVFTVESPAAAVLWEGSADFAPSDRPDYYAIAKALRDLELFRGTGSGVGEGFDLHRPLTRGEGIVMFLRVLGEEADALAYSGGHPFTDVPAWLRPYAAWAYQKGYSNGVAENSFDPDRPISAPEYMELMLRALGYSAAGSDDYSTSLERALDCGALTAGERTLLGEVPFCRAHAAYISYYSLGTAVNGADQTLAQRLAAGGLFTEDQLAAAQARVETPRLP